MTSSGGIPRTDLEGKISEKIRDKISPFRLSGGLPFWAMPLRLLSPSSIFECLCNHLVDAGCLGLV